MNLIKRCRHGMMIVNVKDIWQGKSFDRYGEYSESEVRLFRRVIQPGDNVMDVGANIGSHTVAFARIVTPSGLVAAFEPERQAFYALCGNVSINNFKHVFCFQNAIGATQGNINVPEINEETTVNFGGLELDKDYSNVNHYPVFMNCLDNIGIPKCDFIKIDVEGMEKQVLEGAQKKIDQYKPYLYVEDDRQQKSEELRNFIRSLGYEIYKHEAPFWNPDNFYDERENVFNNTISLNLFCHHASKPCPEVIEEFGLQKV